MRTSMVSRVFFALFESSKDDNSTINHIFDVGRLGLATYFLAIAYLGFAANAGVKFYRVNKFLSRWNTQRFFHLFILIHLIVRTVAFAVLSFFSIEDAQDWHPLVIILYTLPEYLILSVYVLLFLHWLEIFVFSHDQYVVVDQSLFHKRWKFAFFTFTTLLYSVLIAFYIVLSIFAHDPTEEMLKIIEYVAAYSNLVLPALIVLLWFYWAWLKLSGFPYLSLAAEERVKRINHVILLWTLGRVARGIVFFLTIVYEWEQTMEGTYFAMIIVAVLVVSEFLPLLVALNWSIIGILMQGDGSQDLRSVQSVSAPLLGPQEFHTPIVTENSPANRFKIDPNDLQLAGDIISDTGYSFTQRGVLKKRTVSVKGFRLQSADGTNNRLMDELCADIARYSNVLHPHIVKFLGIARVQSTIFIVSEYMAGHSLYDLLRRSSKPFFPETVYNVALQIASAMKYFHSLGEDYVHGCLKSGNVLLDAGLNVKIGDIGISRLKSYIEIMLVERMSTVWSAPEVLQGGHPTQASDVYAFGMICWELVTRQAPFNGRAFDEVRQAVLLRRETPPIPVDSSINEQFLKMISDCWSFEENQRPTFALIHEQLKVML